jgi:Fe2+ transport system protein FeoA
MRGRKRGLFRGRGYNTANPVPGDDTGGICLATIKSGASAEVSGICAGCKAKSRLASLGLMPGSVLKVVANSGVGPLLLSVGESRIMIERGIAAKVVVAPR